ncbi:kinesin, putative [Entamoeba histolytica HM-1:IMSS-B]|uniref:Kinesin, putative n=5 Tax=Entamoeba histolytica TaxID=5759 RepID=C4M9W2_ENTH1|nr:kinesin, putative [Entamoeba histolytica HM-1:IMSS]EMH77000.1 kinesin, putative [Entamoeba histolytica HM-1:IMSS-B]EMS11695.1 chromosome-associated kinesin KIF4A, putative [Entamoeba histolytica HM-3:IMSS]ENY64871.1 chromosome-associated kinesin KIF4A, putative [Entamoeba histolytica HM-1:IMSS-A]GAT98519.1 kinesin putative [Entamoeba histolytica]EAL43944.1 kinesin, putative [Entamoeba histolytica HM-1:IMSS]|eukprot:XP_649327.1 kinesin, putative [Entamoeba histolytica HM-1:IMSS]
MQTVIRTTNTFEGDLSNEQTEYNIDAIMKGKDQETFFKNTVSKMIKRVIEGTDLYVMCYGGKQSGKTFSLEGCFNNIDFTNAGLIPRSINALIEELKTKGKYTIRVSYIQVEDKKISDLLCEGESDVLLKEPTKKFKNQLGGVMFLCATELTVTESTTSQVFSKLNVLRKERTKNEIEKLENVCRVFSASIISSEEEKRGQKEYIDCGRITFIDLPCCWEESNHKGSLLNGLNCYVESNREQRMRLSTKNNDITRILQEALGGQGFLIAIGCISSINQQETIQTLRFLNKLKTIKNVPIYSRHILKSVYDNYLDEEIKQLNYQYSDLLRKNVISKEALEAKKLQQDIQNQRYTNVQIGSLIQRVRKESEPEYNKINQKILIANEYITKKKRTELELRDKITDMIDLAKKIEEHNKQLEDMIQKQVEEAQRQKEYIEKSINECRIDVDEFKKKYNEGEEKIIELMKEINNHLEGEECRKIELPKYSSMNEINEMLNKVIISFKYDGKKTIKIIEDVLEESQQEMNDFELLINQMINRLEQGKSRWSPVEDKIIEQFQLLIQFIQQQKKEMEEEIKEKEKIKEKEINQIQRNKEEIKKEIKELIPEMNKEIESIIQKYQLIISNSIKEKNNEYFPIGNEIKMEECMEIFEQKIQNKIEEVKKELEIEILKDNGNEEKIMKKMKDSIEEEKQKNRFEQEVFKESIEKTKIAIQKIFDESGVIDFIKEQCNLLNEDDKKLKQKHLPLKKLFQESYKSLNELFNEINTILNEFIEKVNHITIDYESEIVIERIQSPPIPSILMQNSEYPTVLDDIDSSKLILKKN